MTDGLYNAASEHDACGVGMVVNIRMVNRAFVDYVEQELKLPLQF